MKNISLFLALNTCLIYSSLCQGIAMVEGNFNDMEFSEISLQSYGANFTGTQDQFEAILLGSGRFLIQVELLVPEVFSLTIDNNLGPQIFLCPGDNLTLTLDSTGLSFKGQTGDFLKWNQILHNDILNTYNINYAKNISTDIEDLSSFNTFLLDIVEKNKSQLDKIAAEYSLSSCEYDYCENRVNYALYTFLWSDFLQRDYPINSNVYQFIYDLPLDDVEAAKSSLDYNRAISVYINLKLRLENGWIESDNFDPTSDSYNNLYFSKIITEIQNEDLRNITLTRKVIELLSTGSTSAIPLFKKYLNDCSDSFYKKIAFRYYNDYIKLKRYSASSLKIDKLQGPLLEELVKHKGKVLYIDFWASWCSPCLASIPFMKKVQEKYKDQALEIIYVSIDDNIGKAEAAAKKLGLEGSLIYLDKNQSTEIRKILDFNGIPHYTIIDKQGIIVEKGASDPKSETTEVIINKLLTE